MNISIGRRIWLGFGSLILLTLIVLYLTNRAVSLSNRIYAEINNIYDPSVKKLNDLSFKLEQSKILINYWAYVESKAEQQEKQNFLEIVGKDIPRVKAEIDTLSTNWDRRDVEQKLIIYQQLQELEELYQQVQIWLPDFESYQSNSGFNWFMARDLTEQGGEIYEKAEGIEKDLRDLISGHEQNRDRALGEMVESFETLQFYSTYIGGFLILVGVIIGLLTARSIVNPVQRLKDKLILMGQGILPSMEKRIASDEIGEMSIALNNLIQGQERIRTFVNAIGSGDFTVDYDPLSDDDELAPDFLKTRDALAENERITEMKITQRTKELEEKNRQINEQSKKVITLYQDLRDSIEYARRLQESILPTDELISKLLPESFVYYQPKDIVSGDFYWLTERENKIFIAAIDCTGHGVPGAFMSLIGHNSLNQAIETSDLNDPGEILTKLNIYATDALNRNSGNTTVRDGMDGALCMIDKDSNKIKFSGAMRPLYYFKEGEMSKIRGDRVAIGGIETKDHRFTSHEIELSKGDTFYIFSDGYPDQFGGPEANGKKYKMARFVQQLKDFQANSMDEQLSMLRFNMMTWQGNHPQVDDILIIGVKI
ncbi:MAG: SpoIIE family protein phosphatase [Flavobacteriales bacterium]|nr:SpoIIE family protein phosphatase [Flavobacteriales bacterium]